MIDHRSLLCQLLTPSLEWTELHCSITCTYWCILQFSRNQLKNCNSKVWSPSWRFWAGWRWNDCKPFSFKNLLVDVYATIVSNFSTYFFVTVWCALISNWLPILLSIISNFHAMLCFTKYIFLKSVLATINNLLTFFEDSYISPDKSLWINWPDLQYIDCAFPKTNLHTLFTVLGSFHMRNYLCYSELHFQSMHI